MGVEAEREETGGTGGASLSVLGRDGLKMSRRRMERERVGGMAGSLTGSLGRGMVDGGWYVVVGFRIVRGYCVGVCIGSALIFCGMWAAVGGESEGQARLGERVGISPIALRDHRRPWRYCLTASCAYSRQL